MMGRSLWSENSVKLTLFCVQQGQHRAGCGDASMMGLSLWSENSAKLTLFRLQHGQHRAGCGDASMMGIYLWSENLAKLTLLCFQHGQHTAGCGDTSMMGLSLWSENSAKLTLFCAPKAPKMLLTALLARASRKTAITISLRSLGWVDIGMSIFGRFLGWVEVLISIFGQFCQKQANMALRYGRLKASPTISGESRYVNVVICIERNYCFF